MLFQWAAPVWALMRKIDDVAPDGVRVVIKWREMVVGASIFIPCINTDKVLTETTQVSHTKGITLEHRVRIEGAKLGVRFWRTE